ncbi:SDR family oxidoreductase [Hymenobacter cellulosilyticus]|uniref:SDR family oxidoreductase n=1 Tax=Hymenobacter cellulosilyticus TaxID=2932248 RepID=A0A8T9QB44_9BACT|nr:SDR family oxidoreductase [Hymenobacter cellulosilyticus]UOQ74727.1 SDR family oxidoreductase [Hymenobacter cellulosilyticus]
MRVFLTGATGFIGSAIVQELIGAGHQVLGLARSEAAAQALVAAGATAHPGSLDDLDSLRRGAAATDGVIHTAFVHDFSDYAGAGAMDFRAVEAIGAALAGSNRPFVITSGTALLPPNRLATEQDAADPASAGAPRVPSEEAVLALAAQGVRSAVIRLPPSVHGPGDHGFVPALIRVAREQGVSAYIGDGLNRWPAVHRLDAARLFRLALEKGVAGSRYHGVAEEGIPIRELAGVIGRRLNLPVVAKTPEEAAAHFGWLAYFLELNSPASSLLTQQQLGWQPREADLLTDLAQGDYFQA